MIDELIAQIKNRIKELSQDIQQDIWYDSAQYEEDYPNDSYTIAIDGIAAAPGELFRLVLQLEEEIKKCQVVLT